MGLASLLRQRALDIGFDLVGIAPVGVGKDLEYSRHWVEQGFAGEMHYLENPQRRDPRSVLASAKSVVCVGLMYNTPYPYSTDSREKPEVRSRKTPPSPPAPLPVS